MDETKRKGLKTQRHIRFHIYKLDLGVHSEEEKQRPNCNTIYPPCYVRSFCLRNKDTNAQARSQRLAVKLQN